MHELLVCLRAPKLSGGTIFLHELHANNRPPRLIVVNVGLAAIDGELRAGTVLECYCATYELGGVISKPVQISSCSTRPFVPKEHFVAVLQNVRLYAGQIDPKNDAHFTVAFEFNGTTGIIDGNLRADDIVELKVRQ